MKKLKTRRSWQERYPRPCKHCGHPQWSHVKGRCLFDSKQIFEPQEPFDFCSVYGTVTGRYSSLSNSPLYWVGYNSGSIIRGLPGKERAKRENAISKKFFTDYVKERNKPERKYR